MYFILSQTHPGVMIVLRDIRSPILGYQRFSNDGHGHGAEGHVGTNIGWLNFQDRPVGADALDTSLDGSEPGVVASGLVGADMSV